MTRIVVPPIRLARPDDEAGFLSFALAEAVSGSLASVNHIVVRSPSIAARWDDATHPRTLAADADVDLIIAGRLLRSGSQLRISAQLIDAMGTVRGSTTVDGSMNDIFALEDAFSTATVALIRRHAGDDDGTFTMTVRRDVPASPRAFELFLRGSEEARRLERMKEARDLLLEAVEDDLSFAPAWAALGRAHRVYGKFYGQRQLNVARAEDAFHHALELSPDLPAAHSYLTHLEAELGRADQAIARLLRHAASHRRDAGWFVGLVHALRYCGVIDASIAAHEEARRLDPNVPTGVEYARIHEVVTPDAAIRQAEAWRSGDEIGGLWPLIAFGVRTERAVASIAAFDRSTLPPVYRTGLDAIVASACEPTAIALEQLETAVTVHDDPEGLFFYGTAMISVGAIERGLDVIEQNVLGGYAAVNLVEHCFAFDVVRGTPRFDRILTGARRRNDRARSIFKQGGGATLLGMH